MKKKQKEREFIKGLWGEGYPCSQVRIEKEIRILEREIWKELYYVYAIINPTTIETLQKGREKIIDKEILKIIDRARYRGPEDGYIYWPDKRQYNWEDANKLGNEIVKVLERVHSLVIDWLGLFEENKRA